MLELAEFDFKKEQKALIRKELRPVLYEHGFVLSGPATYIREQNGLLQEFYFKVETGKLRPWVSCRPVFDARNIVSFGTDNIYVSDCLNPYYGYGWVSFDGWAQKDQVKYNEQFLPSFERLKHSIVNGVLPELNEIHSLHEFITLYQENGLLFQKKIQSMGADIYFHFISSVYFSRGRERMNRIIKEMEEWNLQNLKKDIREYLQSCKNKVASDDEADKIFEEYCDKVRAVNKLMK